MININKTIPLIIYKKYLVLGIVAKITRSIKYSEIFSPHNEKITSVRNFLSSPLIFNFIQYSSLHITHQHNYLTFCQKNFSFHICIDRLSLGVSGWVVFNFTLYHNTVKTINSSKCRIAHGKCNWNLFATINFHIIYVKRKEANNRDNFNVIASEPL